MTFTVNYILWNEHVNVHVWNVRGMSVNKMQ